MMIQYHMTFPNDVVGSFPEFYKPFLQELCILPILPIYEPNLTIKSNFQVDPQHFLKTVTKKIPGLNAHNMFLHTNYKYTLPV